MSTQPQERDIAVARTGREGMRDLESLKVGDRLKGIVVSELEGKTGKKAWVRVGVTRKAKQGRYAYVDGMLRLDKEKGLKPKKVAIDRPVTVYVKEVIAAQGRLEVSLRKPKPRKTAEELLSLRPLADLVTGEELQGVVVSVTQYAAFVSCGVGRPSKRLAPGGQTTLMKEENGFLSADDLPADVALSEQLVKSEDVKRVIDKGDRLTVYVQDVLAASGRFRVTLDESITPEKARTLRRRVSRQKAKFNKRMEAKDLEIGTEIIGTVLKVFDYGLIVDVGAKTNGLVHISSITDVVKSYIVSMWQFAGVGDKMHVRVNGLDDEGRLSLAFVQREQDRERPPNRRERRRRSADSGKVEESSAKESSPSSGGDELGDGGFMSDFGGDDFSDDEIVIEFDDEDFDM